MLDKKVFKGGIEKLLAVYPNWDIKIEDPRVMLTWYNFFKNISDERFLKAVDSHIENIKFNPTVATLKESVASKVSNPVIAPKGWCE